MKTMKIIVGLFAIFLMLPITFYLQYKVFSIIGATELMWFLFWVNLPLAILMQIVSKLLESK